MPPASSWLAARPIASNSAVDFVLDVLGHMSEGSARIEGSSISIEGRATTVADFTDLETKIALGAPQGLILARTDIVPPLADPFVWSAEKGCDGKVRIGGFVPSQRVREALAAAVTNLDADTSTLADGSPAEFEAQSTAAVGVLMLLDSGKVAYDGEVWSLSGSVDTPQEAMDAQAAFNAAGLRAAGWTYSVTLPQAEAAAALPIIDPYVWQAQKAPSGVVTLGGFVPALQARKFFVARAGSGAVDNLQLGAGAPDGFLPGALAALDALAQLDEGLVGFTSGKWTLSGQTGTPAQRLEIERALKAAVDTSGWQITIQARDAAPVVAHYVWSATKAADGSVSLSGYVTTDELQAFRRRARRNGFARHHGNRLGRARGLRRGRAGRARRPRSSEHGHRQVRGRQVAARRRAQHRGRRRRGPRGRGGRDGRRGRVGDRAVGADRGRRARARAAGGAGPRRRASAGGRARARNGGRT